MATKTEALRIFLHDTVQRYRLPGITCAVMQGHEMLFDFAEGFADIEHGQKADLDTVYCLWSVTKVVTATAAMQLVERGLLDLNAPIADYMPEFADAKILQTTSDGQTELVSPREQPKVWHYFTMSAGITYSHDTPEVRAAMRRNPNLGTLDFIRALGKSPLVFEPGTHWRYSHCHEVLGGLVEAVSGRKFGDYLQENIFDPLDIHDATFAMERVPSAVLSAQYKYHSDEEPLESFGKKRIYHNDLPCVEAGGGGLYASARSMVRFADALATGEPILKRETVNLMRKNHLSPEALADMTWAHLAGYGYGLGVRTMFHPEICHAKSPIGEFGWNGAAGSYIMIDPENRLSAFIGTNLLNIPEPWYQPQFRDNLYDAL